MSTTDNNRFLRQWYECKFDTIGFSMMDAKQAMDSKKKWFPYNKGGEFRKYYGNIGLVVNWESDGKEIKKAAEGASGGRIVSQEYYFMPSLSWSKVTAGQFVLRYFPRGFLFDVAGPSIFADFDIQKYVMGLMNSKVKLKLLDELYPTMNYEMGQVSSTPIAIEQSQKDTVCAIVQSNINISKLDWDSFETSWDFKCHPLIPNIRGVWDIEEMKNDRDNLPQRLYIEACFDTWQEVCDNRFHQLKASEEELNRIFIDIYGLQDELTPEVEDKDITVRKADLDRDIRGFISYDFECSLTLKVVRYFNPRSPRGERLCDVQYAYTSRFRRHFPRTVYFLRKGSAVSALFFPGHLWFALTKSGAPPHRIRPWLLYG